MTWLTFQLMLKNISIVMTLGKFGHFSLVSKISQILLELEPNNSINRLVVMRRKFEGLLLLGMSNVPL